MEDQHPSKYIPACSYKAVQPFLSRPIPAIKLKYFSTLSAEQRAEAARDSKLICARCGSKIAIVGSYNSISNLYYCDICAINNYKVFEGFKTRAAAAAHRRRIFDVTYLLTEMLTDAYMRHFGVENLDALSDHESSVINDLSTQLYNIVPRRKKIDLQNTPNQADIEQYFLRLIKKWSKWPGIRFQVSSTS
jgi:hypothetical protein